MNMLSCTLCAAKCTDNVREFVEPDKPKKSSHWHFYFCIFVLKSSFSEEGNIWP
ncbi:hypothetical protein SAMN04487970_102271 [Paenibacillus tianmuensis]|uniref:Uncharacterized protein n=1 Tax=Paenibacillus tianmuensis TaxID=624147 RepID=A0A1G4S4V6_9BACL|nr:hypothetical protein SAMN04487970_102271 [Paenibacillus tianmuensis]